MIRYTVLIVLCLPSLAAAQDLAMLKAKLSRSLTEETKVVSIEAPLVIKVSDTRKCEPGEIAESEIVQRLAQRRWRNGKHYVIQRSDDGPCPQFFYRGKELCSDGWDGWEKFNDELSAAMGVGKASISPPPATSVAVGVLHTEGIVLNPGETLYSVCGQLVGEAYSQSYVEPQQRSFGIPPARSRWYQNGHSVSADHLRSHGIDPTGMSQAEMDRAHSHAHEGTWNPAWAPTGGSYAESQQYYAARPAKARAQPARRFFGAVLGMGGCPAGGCP